MMPYRSFLMRVWRVNEHDRACLRFALEDVVSHASGTFVSLAELGDFIEQLMNEPAPAPASPPPPAEESPAPEDTDL